MTKIEKTINLMKEENTYRRYDEGDHKYDDFSEAIFEQDHSHKCPTYVHKTPPCQGSCPSGEDIRGWLQIVRGIEQPPKDMSMSEYAFRRSTSANPFPSQMGRVCPAPCQSGCNRNEVDDYVGINANNSETMFAASTAYNMGNGKSAFVAYSQGYTYWKFRSTSRRV